MANKVLEALAPAFNFLLGIEPGHFGHSRRASEPSPANLRAAARLAAVRAKNKSIPITTVKSRQVLRAEERSWRKHLLSELKAKTRLNRGNGAAVTRLP
jgi:hypothetical protein